MGHVLKAAVFFGHKVTPVQACLNEEKQDQMSSTAVLNFAKTFWQGSVDGAMEAAENVSKNHESNMLPFLNDTRLLQMILCKLKFGC